MKIIWEASDIKAGMQVGKIGTNEAWMICRRHPFDRKVHDEHRDWICVNLNDGLAGVPYSTNELVGMLTDNGFVHIEFLSLVK